MTSTPNTLAAKEQEGAVSRWTNPIVIGLFATALTLAGNIIVTRLNNTNTLALERQRAQSNLILEAIKTGNNTDAACKNLTFFADLGLIDDPHQAIHNRCASAPKGPPSLPTISAQPLSGQINKFLEEVGSVDLGYVRDADTGDGIAGAKVTIDQNPSVETDSKGHFTIPDLYLAKGLMFDVNVEKEGYQTDKEKLGGWGNSLGLYVINLHRKK
jgi:hypothetical protein